MSESVTKLREFDLHLSRAGTRVLCKDIENQFRAVYDFAIEESFKVTLLNGSEIALEDDYVRFDGGTHLPYLFDFSFAQEGSGTRVFDDCLYGGSDFRTRGFRETGKLVHAFLGGIDLLGLFQKRTDKECALSMNDSLYLFQRLRVRSLLSKY